MKAIAEAWRAIGQRISPVLNPVLRVLNGPVEKPTYGIAQWIFTRGLAFIYFIAFWSWWVQIDGLVGSKGIVPAARYLSRVKEYLASGTEAFLTVPTILLWNASDAALHGVCAAGVVLSILVMAGLRQGMGLALLWFLYLSLVTTGSVFMSFQWDILLLEAGFLGILFAPWKHTLLGLTGPRETFPQASRWMAFLIWALLFKLMFFSGILKIANDETWRTGLALTYHYETQPIPHALAWYAHHLPKWFQTFSSHIMLVIEIALPFGIFLGRRLRWVAGMATIGLMLAIMATGNFTYFNLLTILLCVPLFDDQHWPERVRNWFQPSDAPPIWKPLANPWPGRVTRLAIGVPILLMSLQVCQRQLMQEVGWLKKPVIPAFIDNSTNKLYQSVRAFYPANGYGLFRVMTTKRPEIIIEGSMDGQTWEAYGFRWKPDDRLDRPPRLVAPHQPRMDWQMWFAALGYQFQRSARTMWFENLMARILEGEPSVLQLFEHNPFPDKPPQYVRAKIYHYNYTTPEEKRDTGNWWKREELGLYFPVVQKRS